MFLGSQVTSANRIKVLGWRVFPNLFIYAAFQLTSPLFQFLPGKMILSEKSKHLANNPHET